MEIKTPRLCLREFRDSDLQALLDLDAHPEMHIFEREQPSVEETQQKLESYLSDQLEMPRKSYIMGITIPPNIEIRGIVKLSRQWEAIREWETGWAVHRNDWGRGYATEAAMFLMDWGFRELNIHRIVAFCHTDNAASVRVMQKLGMHLDGRLRETRWLNGEWWDEYVYAVLEKEWKKIKT
jgi:ribosomal-protein-alanine N-acetyltransferase